jgi:RimJ/RimL family protein N-acetyltransferase
MEITQRNATLHDAQVLLAWRNHPKVRRFSVQSELIPINEHMRWLEARLGRSQSEPFYLFELNNAVIGMCRLDLMVGAPDKYEISILVDPNQHAKGVGTRILDMSCDSFFNLYPNKSIVANVGIDNLVSKKMFTNAGFSLRMKVGGFLYLEKYLD